MICSKTKLGLELDKIKQLLIENGYPADALFSCNKPKFSTFCSRKNSWSGEVPGIPKTALDW